MKVDDSRNTVGGFFWVSVFIVTLREVRSPVFVSATFSFLSHMAVCSCFFFLASLSLN